jgi:hypothetical protein
MARGVKWIEFDPASLSKDSKAAHKEYKDAFKLADDAGKKLKSQLNQEAKHRFPNGNVKGERPSFNVINGNVMYVMVKVTEDAKETQDPFASSP